MKTKEKDNESKETERITSFRVFGKFWPFYKAVDYAASKDPKVNAYSFRYIELLEEGLQKQGYHYTKEEIKTSNGLAIRMTIRA